jgi:hypothetical protein
MAEPLDTLDTSKKTLLAALEASLGIVTTACKRAGVARSTYYNWMKDDEAFRLAVEELTEVAVDFGESQLHKLMQGYTQPDTKIFLNSDTKEPIEVPIVKHVGPDAASVIFFLKTKGKKRGYVPSKAIDLTSGGEKLPSALEIRLVPAGPPLASSESEVEDV